MRAAEGQMSRAVEESNRRMLRARDAMDRDYAKPLDIQTLAGIAEAVREAGRNQPHAGLIISAHARGFL